MTTVTHHDAAFFKELPEGVSAGEWSYGNLRALRQAGPWKRTDMRVGKFCSLGMGFCALLGSEHNTDWVSTYPFAIAGLSEHIEGHPKTFGDIEIGNDVWVGMNVTVFSGTRVGDGAVIAAGSYLRGDVPPYSIYGGNPARLLSFRFRPEVIQRLQQIAWWNWPLERIKKAVPLLSQKKVELFIEAVERGEL
jgi:acetyltransferase-like isoleucine patch superfamily enzyme